LIARYSRRDFCEIVPSEATSSKQHRVSRCKLLRLVISSNVSNGCASIHRTAPHHSRLNATVSPGMPRTICWLVKKSVAAALLRLRTGEPGGSERRNVAMLLKIDDC